MYDLISIGNITVDFYFQGKSFTRSKDRFQLAIGGKYIADHLYTRIGGGGANVAIGATQLGLKTALAGIIGENSFKSLILDSLRKSQVSTSFVGVEKMFNSTSVILLDPSGEKTVIHYSTPREHLIYHNLRLEDLHSSRAVFMANLQEIPLEERIRILSAAKKDHLVTFLNLGVNDCRRPFGELKHLLSLADVLLFNGYEFADLIKASYKDIHFGDDVVSWYAPYLSSKIVIITAGEKGSYGYHDENIYYRKATRPKNIVDTTGAGDAFTAGFIADFIHRKNIDTAMEKAADYASLIISFIGANEA